MHKTRPKANRQQQKKLYSLNPIRPIKCLERFEYLEHLEHSKRRLEKRTGEI